MVYFKIWNILASILSLGNLNFTESKANFDGSFVKNCSELQICANILQVESVELEKALCAQVSHHRFELCKITSWILMKILLNATY